MKKDRVERGKSQGLSLAERAWLAQLEKENAELWMQRHVLIIDHRPEFDDIRTRYRSPHTNGVRERAFGSLKYEHLYGHDIADGVDLARESEQYRQIFNHTRPHEALDMARPADVHLTATPDLPDPETEPES